MKSDIEMFTEVNKTIKKYVPKWRTGAKKDSRLHKIIGIVADPLLGYNVYFWTTVGFTASYPAGSSTDWVTLCHEGVHGIQNKKFTRVLFNFLYLCPQILFPICFVLLGAFLSPWYLIGILGAFLPLPAPFRAYAELEAYKLSVMLAVWVINRENYIDDYIDRIAGTFFAGPSYFWMWPFKAHVKKQLHGAKLLAQTWGDGPTGAHPYIKDIQSLVNNYKN